MGFKFFSFRNFSHLCSNIPKWRFGIFETAYFRSRLKFVSKYALLWTTIPARCVSSYSTKKSRFGLPGELEGRQEHEIFLKYDLNLNGLTSRIESNAGFTHNTLFTTLCANLQSELHFDRIYSKYTRITSRLRPDNGQINCRRIV